MSRINFLVGIHNHQPVGNFGHVFEQSYETCYLPQMEMLKDHPGVRIALHHSGPLLEWIEANRPKYFDLVSLLVERGQVEILSGGFYEPILSSIPVGDAVGQIEMMNQYIIKRFGYTPKGLWMTERIWDPYMPIVISATGLKYTLLDDTHFYYAGLTGKDDTLPKRLLKEAAKTGPAKGRVSDLDKMLPEYYQLRGWTSDGVPSKETLDRLGV